MTRKYNSIAEHWQILHSHKPRNEKHTYRNRNGESKLEPVNNKKNWNLTYFVCRYAGMVSNVKKSMQISKMLWWPFETTVSQGLFESNFSILEE